MMIELQPPPCAIWNPLTCASPRSGQRWLIHAAICSGVTWVVRCETLVAACWAARFSAIVLPISHRNDEVVELGLKRDAIAHRAVVALPFHHRVISADVDPTAG